MKQKIYQKAKKKQNKVKENKKQPDNSIDTVNVYNQYPNMVCYVSIENGKLIFQTNDKVMRAERVIDLLHSIVGEYVRQTVDMIEETERNEQDQKMKEPEGI